MRKPLNPFILTGYSSPDYFCDRRQEYQWLLDQVQNDRNVVLHAWRRMGKTALIFHLFHQLNVDKKADCLFVDLLGTSTLQEAVRNIAEAVVHKYGSMRKGLASNLSHLIGSIGASVSFDPFTGLPQLDLNFRNNTNAEQTLSSLGDFLSKQKKPIIIALDEFQQIVNYENERAEAIFRSWAQQFPAIRYIYSGSHRHMMISMFSESNRPFYRSAQLYNLDAIPEQEYIDFIHQKFTAGGKKIEVEHINSILGWSRRQTYYVQLACNKLYAKTDDVKISDLQQVCIEMIQQEVPIFSSYQQLLTDFQWSLLKALAKENGTANPLSKKFIKKYDLGSASSVQRALATLVKKELVVVWDDVYHLHDTLLLRWLERL